MIRALMISEAGSPDRPNEDWIAATADLVVLLDGATSRTKTGCKHGVAWFVNRLGGAIAHHAPDHDLSLREILSNAINQVASLHPECDLNHPGSPSAAVGIARRTTEDLEVLVLADVSIAIQDTAGHVDVITDDRADNSVRGEMELALSLPVGGLAREKELTRIKRIQQSYRNQPGGYFVAGADPTVADEATITTRRLNDVCSIALLSDGATRAVTMFDLMTWPELFKQLADDGPKATIQQVRATERADAKAQRWPRSKVSDDASIAYVHLAPMPVPRRLNSLGEPLVRWDPSVWD